ncbi:MAG: PAS domain S-box protein, partial [Bacteroidales bacterium]
KELMQTNKATLNLLEDLKVEVEMRKNAEETLKQSEERYRTLVENSNDMIWTIDRDGNFVFLNEIASKTAGIELEDWLGKSFIPLLLVDDIPMITDIFHRTLNGEICSYELRLKQPDESIKTILTTTSPIIVNDNIEGIVSFGQDITERKLADEILRESEQRFSDMAINSSGVVYQFFARKDGTTGFYYMSPKAEEMFGYSSDLNSPDWNLGEHVYPEDKEAFMNAIGQAIVHVQPLDFECRVITSSGVKWIQLLSRPTLKNDEVVFNGIMIDVTERKQTQELLEKSREEFKALFDKAPIGYHEIDNEGRIVRINEAELKMFGRSYDEMIGQHIWNFIVNKEESKTAVFAKLSGEMQPLDVYERDIMSKDGTVLNVLMRDRILKDEKGKIIGIQTTVQNITVRKKTEVALRMSEERLSTLINSSPDFICFKDDEGRWQIANKAAEELFFLQNIDYLGKTDKELSELTQPFFKQAHLDCIESDSMAWDYGKAYNVEEVVPQPNGNSRVYDVIKVPLFKENGDRKALIVLGREITERKKIESELRKSEKKYSDLFTQMLDGFALHEIICNEAGEPVDYRFLDVNPAFEKQTGLKAKDIIGKTVLEVMPRTEHIWIQLYGEVALTGHPTTFDDFSQEIWKHFQVNVFSPAPRQFACLVSDITERKNAEATIRNYQNNLETLVKERTHELMVRETYLSAIIDNHPGMFWMKDDKGQFIFSNRANSKFLRLIYGEKAEEIFGKTDFDFCPLYQARLYQKEDNDVAKLKKEITSEDAMIIGTKEYWFEKLKFPVIDAEGKTIGVAGYSIDITERIKRDARLRMQSEAFESFALTIVITNKDGMIEWANSAFEKLTGYRIKEVVGQKANMLRSGKMTTEFYKELWSTVLAGKVWTGEFLNKRKDGSLYYEESTITPVRDREGLISHFIALKMNITHRKEMEEALRISDERWQFAIEGSGDGVYDTDLIKQKQFYSPQWKLMLGYNEDEIGDTMEEWNSRIHPEDLEHAISEFNNYLAGVTNTYNNEHRLRCKNGSYKWVLTRGKIVERNENGDPTRLIGTLTDITEIKLLEES